MRATLSAAEAADEIGVSEWYVRKLVHDGLLAKIPHLGKRVRIARVEVDRFVSQGLAQVEVEGSGVAS